MDMINYNPAPKSLLMAYSQEFGIELFSLKSGGFDRFEFESFFEDMKKAKENRRSPSSWTI